MMTIKRRTKKGDWIINLPPVLISSDNGYIHRSHIEYNQLLWDSPCRWKTSSSFGFPWGRIFQSFSDFNSVKSLLILFQDVAHNDVFAGMLLSSSSQLTQLSWLGNFSIVGVFLLRMENTKMWINSEKNWSQDLGGIGNVLCRVVSSPEGFFCLTLKKYFDYINGAEKYRIILEGSLLLVRRATSIDSLNLYESL